MNRVWIVFILILLCNSVCWAVEVAPRITDREIVERLSKLEEGQKAILREIDQRFESIDQRFESMEQRFDQLTNLLIAIISAFAGIVAVTIGFAIWDRRTMIRPFETKVRVLENRIEDVADRCSNKGSPDNDRLNSLIGVMRKYAGSNKEVADAMRSFNLL
ncbi:MAG: hypothetical protein LWX55_00230 [Deltaproteobacteria bacterium]|jgi:hypothetical protein|nr:hypothetical protein [Deltaproteobacteria bacterium]